MALITLAEAKDILGITSTANDVRLQASLDVAHEKLYSYLEVNTLEVQTITDEVTELYGVNKLILDAINVDVTAPITITTLDGDTMTQPASYVRRTGYYYTVEMFDANGKRFTPHHCKFVISYTAGFTPGAGSNAPASLKTCLALMMNTMFTESNREAGIDSYTIGKKTVSYSDAVSAGGSAIFGVMETYASQFKRPVLI